MARYFPAILVLFFLGCDNSPDPQQILESSRKTTAEVEKQLELTRKSTSGAQKRFDESLKSPEAFKLNTAYEDEIVKVVIKS